jgi:hypothetical protein
MSADDIAHLPVVSRHPSDRVAFTTRQLQLVEESLKIALNECAAFPHPANDPSSLRSVFACVQEAIEKAHAVRFSTEKMPARLRAATESVEIYRRIR